MQDHHSQGGERRPDCDRLERAALVWLLEQPQPIYTIAELALELDVTEVLVEDAVASLAACGLVNRWELFVVASRAARRFDELDVLPRGER